MTRDLVFISYSHTNPEWRDRLLVLLKPFVRQGRLQVWADPYIKTGAMWRREITTALERTRVGVVLVTPDLLASDFVADIELPGLLRAAKAGHITLVLVPVEQFPDGATRSREGDLSEYQWPWSPARPLVSLSPAGRNKALVTVTNAIVGAAGEALIPVEVTSPSSASPRMTDLDVAGGNRLGMLYWLPPPPPNYLPRGPEHDVLKRTVLGRSTVVGLSAGVTQLGLHGQGGIGKTVLAWSVAQDDDVRRGFPDGIFWVTVGQHPRVEMLQSQLASQFGTPITVDDIASGIRLLGERLRGRACLVVLDDVWHLVHAKAFDVLDGTSRLLVTTRDRSLLTALGAQTLRLDALDPNDAITLMAQWANVEPTALPRVAQDIARAVDYLPLGLSLAGAQVRDGRSWADLQSALRDGDLEFLDHPYGSILKSMRASVDALHAAEAVRYFELAVFPEDEKIPSEIVELLWKETAGLDERHTRALLAQLASKNLLAYSTTGRSNTDPATDVSNRAVSRGDVITMHDLQHDFVRLAIEGLPALHGTLVEALRHTIPESASGHRVDNWARLPAHLTYGWQFLAYHLWGGGRREELAELLTSPDWLIAKLKQSSAAALVSDYGHSLGDAGLRSVRDALVLSAHVLAKDPDALFGQLRGRLCDSGDPRIQSLIDRLPSLLRRRPMLQPEVTCLTRPGGALVQTLEGQLGVTAVAVLPDGQRALTGGSDGTLKLWDLASGALLQIFEGHTGEVKAVAVLPDGQRALSGADDETLRLWDLVTGALLQTFEGHGGVTAVAVLSDGKRALSDAEDGKLQLWDLASGARLQSLEAHTRGVTAVALLPDGQRALSGGADGKLKLWDLTSGARLQIFDGHTGEVKAVAVLPDGQCALSGAADETLKFWDLASGTLIKTLEGHTFGVTAMAVVPGGQRALSGTGDGKLKLWDLASGALLQSLEGQTLGVTAVAVLPDGQHALSGGLDGSLKLWNLGSSPQLQTIQDHTGFVTAVAVLPDGQRGVSGGLDGMLKLWDLTSGALLRTIESHTRGVWAVAVLPGERALSGAIDDTLKLWDLATGALLRTFEGHFGGVTAVAVLSDGNRALSGAEDGTLRLWDLASGAPLQRVEVHSRGVKAVAVLPDGQRALSGGSDGTLKLWDLVSGALLQIFEGHTGEVKAVAVLPDGQRVLSGADDGMLKLWDVTSGTLIKTLEGPFAVTAVAVLPDGQHALSGGLEGTLKLWDITSGELLTTFYGDAPFLSVAVGPDGGRIFAGDALGRVHILTIVRS